MPFKNGNPPLYLTWKSMIARCYNPKCNAYRDYGGRGIKVCPEWRHNYKQFIADMMPSYQIGLTLDRIDNNGDYSPKNCRWATRKEQQKNQRRTRRVIINGIEFKACELAEKYNLKVETVIDRAKRGMPFYQVIKKGVSFNKFKIRTHCGNGHLLNERNTYINPKGVRLCRMCRNIRLHPNIPR